MVTLFLYFPSTDGTLYLMSIFDIDKKLAKYSALMYMGPKPLDGIGCFSMQVSHGAQKDHYISRVMFINETWSNTTGSYARIGNLPSMGLGAANAKGIYHDSVPLTHQIYC